MKMMKRIGAILITIAMLASMSVCAFADDAAKVQIDSVTATYLDNEDTTKDGVYTITVDYTVEGADADTQVTMLAYIFDGRTAGLNDTSNEAADAFDANKQTSGYAEFVQGAARAIDQQNYTGTMTFKLLKAAEGKTQENKGRAALPTDYLLVKIGTDKAGIGAQAFFVSLADAEDENALHGIYGDVTGDEKVNDFDWIAVLNHTSGEIENADLDDETTAAFKAADVTLDGKINDFDWIGILNHTSGEIESELIETEF